MPAYDLCACPCSQDVKTLKRDVKLNFPDLSDDDMEALLPGKAEVQLMKLRNKATAYSCGSADPLFFDPEGRGDLLVPTVYALWRCPNMLDKLLTYSEVSPKVRALWQRMHVLAMRRTCCRRRPAAHEAAALSN